GEVPFVPRRPDRRTRYADRRAGRADAPPAEVLAARDPRSPRDRQPGGRHHRTGAAARGPEEQREGAPGLPPPDGLGDQAAAGLREDDRARRSPGARADP